MGKDKKNMRFGIIAAISLLIGLFACQPEIIIDNVVPEVIVKENMGRITFDFPIPDRSVPVDKIHRVNLSIAADPFSLYSGYFLESANVSD